MSAEGIDAQFGTDACIAQSRRHHKAVLYGNSLICEGMPQKGRRAMRRDLSIQRIGEVIADIRRAGQGDK